MWHVWCWYDNDIWLDLTDIIMTRKIQKVLSEAEDDTHWSCLALKETSLYREQVWVLAWHPDCTEHSRLYNKHQTILQHTTSYVLQHSSMLVINTFTTLVQLICCASHCTLHCTHHCTLLYSGLLYCTVHTLTFIYQPRSPQISNWQFLFSQNDIMTIF